MSGVTYTCPVVLTEEDIVLLREGMTITLQQPQKEVFNKTDEAPQGSGEVSGYYTKDTIIINITLATRDPKPNVVPPE